MELSAGQSISFYEILGPLGVGGMGEVYRARDTRLDREVALKVLPEELASDNERLVRFEREAKALASLNHANVAQIFGIDQVGDVCFLALELVPGEDLEERLRRGALSIPDAISIAGQTAAGVQAAHDAGIVHRDLKPANVRVTPDGVVKVLDFGLAKPVFTEARDQVVEGRSSELTRDGAILGTLPYMSPEQARGQAVGPATDVWSVACVLFECLAGSRPFPGDTAVDVLAAIVSQEPDWTLLPDATPPLLRAALALCLTKSVDERPSDLGPLRSALQGRSATRATRSSAQEIRFCQSKGGVRLAYATSGDGPAVIKAANWLNHLEFDWESPVWRHVIDVFSRNNRFVRYDARGNGLSDRDVTEMSLETFVDDLETVVDASGLERFALLGISQGASVCISYALRHPERVSHLILHGGYARGWRHRGSAEDVERREALATLMQHGWGEETPAFRSVFSSLYLPEGTEEQKRWFSDLERVSTSPENAVLLWRAIGDIEISDRLADVTTPTLVTHCRGDAAVPFEEGRHLASSIPGARFLALDSLNHLVLEQEPAWTRFSSGVEAFLAE